MRAGRDLVIALREARDALARAATEAMAGVPSRDDDAHEWIALAAAASAGLADALGAFEGVEAVEAREGATAAPDRPAAAMRAMAADGSAADVALRQGAGPAHPRTFAAADVVVTRGAVEDEGAEGEAAPRPPRRPGRTPPQDLSAMLEAARSATVPVTKVPEGASSYAFGGGNRSPKRRDGVVVVPRDGE